MEKYLKAFNVLQKRYNLELFYSISIDSSGIRLQGYFNDKLHNEVMKLRLNGEVSTIGYIVYKYKYVTIIMTPCSK
jgi:hypothetical protein